MHSISPALDESLNIISYFPLVIIWSKLKLLFFVILLHNIQSILISFPDFDTGKIHSEWHSWLEEIINLKDFLSLISPLFILPLNLKIPWFSGHSILLISNKIREFDLVQSIKVPFWIAICVSMGLSLSLYP